LGADVIGGLVKALDNVLGRGEAAVTVPPLDGALRPNRVLDEATWRLPLAEVDSIVVAADRVMASAGRHVHLLQDGAWCPLREHEAEVTCLCPVGDGGIAVALATGDIVIDGGRLDGRRYCAAADARCITAIAVSDDALFVANGSATNGVGDWQLDLLQRNASGSIWRIDCASGGSTQVAGGLGYPAGLAADDAGLVYAEAWKHRLVRMSASEPGKPKILYTDIPGYPGRLASSKDGHWLAVFAPRSQIVEFVLREPAYKSRMVAEVPRPFWIAPKLRSGRSFYEPLQGGGVKHLGVLKPWAPTLSAGLCVGLDRNFQPRISLHSRADGATHGVTAVAEHEGRLFAAAQGDGIVVAVPLDRLWADE
jgi:hypothetical protein